MSVPDWTPEELQALDYGLRKHVEAKQALKENLQKRIKWPETPQFKGIVIDAVAQAKLRNNRYLEYFLTASCEF